MTPKEKAKELIITISESDRVEERSFIGLKTAKVIALKVVDEIIPIVQSYEDALPPSQTSDEYEYWQQVKQEIELL